MIVLCFKSNPFMVKSLLTMKIIKRDLHVLHVLEAITTCMYAMLVKHTQK